MVSSAKKPENRAARGEEIPTLPASAQPLAMLTVDDLAARLKLSRTAIYALCEAGELKHHRVGTGKKKRFRFTEQQFAEYVAGTEVKQPAVAAILKIAGRGGNQRRRRRSQQQTAAGYSCLREGGYK